MQDLGNRRGHKRGRSQSGLRRGNPIDRFREALCRLSIKGDDTSNKSMYRIEETFMLAHGQVHLSGSPTADSRKVDSPDLRLQTAAHDQIIAFR